MTPALEHLRPAVVDQHLADAAVTFGKNLKRWRIRAGWAQDTAQQWGQALGVLHVFSSQWSHLENGKLPAPQPKLFRALGAMNRLLAGGNYGPIPSDLKERLQQAEPVLHPDGTPWVGADFFRCFVGDLEWPHPQQPMTDAEAAEVSEWLRQAFDATAVALGVRRSQALSQLEAIVPAEHWPAFEEVLFGADYSPTTLEPLHHAPQQWVRRWHEQQQAGNRLPADP